jgi:general secretion pathway protein E
MPMNDSARKPASADRLLDLRGLLEDLRRDGYITQADVDRVASTTRTREQAGLHPLSFIAEQSLPNARKPGRHLDAELLTEWLAQKAGQPYYTASIR